MKPRTRHYVHMDLVAIDPPHHRSGRDDPAPTVTQEARVLTEHGQVTYDIPAYFLEAAPTIAVTLDPSWFLDHLNTAYEWNPAWRYTLYRSYTARGAGSISRTKLTTFGFRGEGTRKQRLHQCWDPRTMSPDATARFIESPDPVTLLTWATDLRSWAQDNDLELRNAFAGYASQLLRDSRFYPEPRRRVPRATNERARQALPGNLITLRTDLHGTHQVTCIDQRTAHHRIVQETPLPSSNDLFARGYYGEYEDVPEYWIEHGTPQYERITRTHGLLYVGLRSTYSTREMTGLRLPVQEQPGFQRGFIWTNTISFLESTGTTIGGVYAAWTSTTTDDGLSHYGQWAESQISNCSPSRKQWLKPLLHSAYGLLATRPRPLEVGHRQPGSRSTFLLGAREFPVKSVTLDTVSPQFVNVIQRGMIEAETQVRSLTLARELVTAGCEVTHIHTDGMHVKGDLPLLPDTWAVTALTNTWYMDRVSWVSDERACLPGRDEQLRYEIIKHHANLHTIASERRSRGRLSRDPRPRPALPDHAARAPRHGR